MVTWLLGSSGFHSILTFNVGCLFVLLCLLLVEQTSKGIRNPGTCARLGGKRWENSVAKADTWWQGITELPAKIWGFDPRPVCMSLVSVAGDSGKTSNKPRWLLFNILTAKFYRVTLEHTEGPSAPPGFTGTVCELRLWCVLESHLSE